MAKSKKSKKSDFQKVKLKVGRRLPKVTNVTDISFKAKKISLPGQTKEYVGEAGEKSKYDLAELTKGLEGRKRSSILISNLQKIKTLLSEDGGESGSLTQILDALLKTSFLLISQEPAVRKAALGVIKVVFESLSVPQMSSFFPQLKSSIRRATTHLNSGVRNDSLVFLELVLKHYPSALCDSLESLKIFLDLISHKKVFPNSAQSSRELYSNPDEKIAAQHWRYKVLGLFVKYLDAYNAVAKQQTDENLENPLDVFDRDKHAFVVHEHGLKTTSILKFSLRKGQKHLFGIKAASDVKCNLEQFLQLLVAIWKEEDPKKPHLAAVQDIYFHAIKNMLIVLQIICKLIELVRLLCRTEFSPDFLQGVKESFATVIKAELLHRFPLCWSQFPDQNESFVLSVNITFCKIFASIVLGTKNCVREDEERFLNYVLEALSTVKRNEKNFSLLIAVLKTFVLHEAFSSKENIQLDSVLTVYGMPNHKEGYLAAQNFFLELVTDTNNEILNNKTVQYWLRYLPEEFIRISKQGQLNDNYLSVVQKVASRGFPTFVQSLEENFSGLVSVLVMSDEKGQQFVASLIAMIENFTLDDFIQLAHAFRDPSVSINSIRYILIVLNQRANNEQSALRWKEHYLSFLFNIALGVFEGEKEVLKKEEEVVGILTSNIELQLSEFQLVPFQDLSRHEKVLQVAINAMQSLAERESVNSCLQVFLTTYINSVEAEFMPVNVAVAVLEIVSQLLAGKPMVEDLVYYTTDFTVALYVYQNALDSSPSLSDAEHTKYSVRRFLPGKNIPKLRSEAIRHVSKYVRKADRCHLEYIGRIILTIIDTYPVSLEECKAIQSMLNKMASKFGEDVHEDMWFVTLEERLM